MDQARIAVVTGGSRGIGRAVVKDLAASGVTVVFTYNGNQAKAEDVVREIEEAGGQAVAIKCDVSREKEVKDLFKQVRTSYGKLDILVNNAGITNDGFVAMMSEAKFEEVLKVNLGGTFLTTREAVKLMMKQKSGVIINLASTTGISGNKAQTNYAASKGGIISFTKALAQEVAEHNIRANVVAPGFIETDMTKGMDQGVLSRMLELIPLRRIGKPEDIAYLVTFLSSDRASYITGKVYTVDGGMVNG
ncbi:3-oxoacyl-[acyl-carrier-protein] reductase [Tumebacillus permanentifrigoris]|uniref:3-oxoacyl-[acyl-carrier-protein] reductase n=1 Tax=Tumebacillus permanentifrigoris TaxID=378543 RepID=A0A316DF89_9BACL|nr:3-oxoacyl-[acyl-carrier-protein] reductase [Tumebacillus permanentifrigoris]PWK15859.1 3-oxoacyl-[acyl-carrier-protein] reductase [Tumebacillus permanentifrigoris]